MQITLGLSLLAPLGAMAAVGDGGTISSKLQVHVSCHIPVLRHILCVVIVVRHTLCDHPFALSNNYHAASFATVSADAPNSVQDRRL